MRLQSYLSGRWQDGAGSGTPLIDPVTGEELARASGDGLDLAAALAHARMTGGAGLRSLTHAARAGLLGDIAATLVANRPKYADIALRNSGNTAADAAFDIDGAIGTLKYYAAVGRTLGETTVLAEPGSERLGRDEAFRAIHVRTPVRGVAVHINAFNFPAWGLWEKAAVALLAGVPVLAKPATATAWLAAEMVRDVLAAGLLPPGALSLLCGGGRDLLDHLRPGDVVSFTGSADTAALLRANPAVTRGGIRFGVEADSLNLCCLGPDVAPGDPLFDAFVREVVRELTLKAGQKCTAIRRILVPRERAGAVADALAAALGAIPVGDPRDPAVSMGPLVSKAQQATAWTLLDRLSSEARTVLGGERDFAPAGVDPAAGCFVPPTLLLCDEPRSATAVHEVEVFGPVATVMPYGDTADAIDLALRGGGSLVASAFSADDGFALELAAGIAPAHGRVLLVDPSVAKSHTGHGVVMPQCVHGGPGRAGGGEELGGLRALAVYQQRTAVQASQARLAALAERAGTITL